MIRKSFHEYSKVQKYEEPVPAPRCPYPIFDTHLHFFDFLQESDGLENLCNAMDQCGVKKAVLFGLPMIKLWNEHSTDRPPAPYMFNDSRFYYYSATDYMMMNTLHNASAEIRQRFYPFICGVNICDMNAPLHIERLLTDFHGEIFGIGEIMSRHDDLTFSTYGELPRANHPALLKIYDIAAEHNLPVLIHHNITDAYTNSPNYLNEMLEGLYHNRSAKIIWAHVGVSRRVEVDALPFIAKDVLESLDNVYFDISWFVYDNYIYKEQTVQKNWIDLFEKYPDRFLFGSDVVGHWASYPAIVRNYFPLFEALSEKAANKITHENLLNLLPHNQ